MSTRQGQGKTQDHGATGDPGASATKWGHEYVPSNLAAEKNGVLRLCVDLKIPINGRVTDKYYPVLDMETIFHNLHGAFYFGQIDLTDAYCQIELDDDAKNMYNQHIWLKEFFINLPELY